MKNKKFKKINFSKLYNSEKSKLNELLNIIQIEKLKNFDKLVKQSIRAIANNKKIIFYGNGGGKLKRYTKYPIIIPSKEVSLIQVYQLFLGQIYCQILEDYFF